MNRLKAYTMASIAAPCGVLLICSAVAAFEAHRSNTLAAERTAKVRQIDEIKRQIAQVSVQPVGTRYPAEDASVQEQPAFLNTLRAYADNAHVQIVRWTNVAAPPPPAAPDPNKKAAPAEVGSVLSTIEIKGKFNDARQFMYDLLYCPRLLTMSDVIWTRGDKWPLTHVTFTLTRYIYTTPAA